MNAQPKRYRCPACLRVLDRPETHGNRKTLKSFCELTGKDALLRRVIYRSVR